MHILQNLAFFLANHARRTHEHFVATEPEPKEAPVAPKSTLQLQTPTHWPPRRLSESVSKIGGPQNGRLPFGVPLSLPEKGKPQKGHLGKSRGLNLVGQRFKVCEASHPVPEQENNSTRRCSTSTDSHFAETRHLESLHMIRRCSFKDTSSANGLRTCQQPALLCSYGWI